MPINNINKPNDLRYVQFQWHRLSPSGRAWVIRKMKWSLFIQESQTRWTEIKEKLANLLKHS